MSNKSTKLKEQLILTRSRTCESCKLTSWLEQPVPLELHHVDGDSKNNQESNCKLLCANCHALTPNYRGKNKKRKQKPFKKIVPDEVIISMIPTCYNVSQVLLEVGLIAAGANYARVNRIMADNNLSLKQKEVSAPATKRLETIRKKYGNVKNAVRPTKIVWPSKEELEQLLRTNSMLALSKQLGISDNSIRKQAKKYGLDYHSLNPWCRRHNPKVVAVTGVEPVCRSDRF